MDRKTEEFIIQIIDAVAKKQRKSTKEVVEVLKKTGCIEDYLEPLYDILHKLGTKVVVQDVIQYVKKRGEEL